jgi:hypothetical protein
MVTQFRNPPRKGARIIGYRPLTGQPRDAEGRLILEYIYAAGKQPEAEGDNPTLL